jgi:hypothetical protein
MLSRVLVSDAHSTLLYSTLLYSTLLYSTLLYSTLLYSTLLNNTTTSFNFFDFISSLPSVLHSFSAEVFTSRMYFNPGVAYKSRCPPVPPKTDHSKGAKKDFIIFYPLAVISFRWYRWGNGIYTRHRN